jgi:Zn ribbon nucleic-acid-binding protein
MGDDAAHPHPVPVVACMTCGHYMPISEALGKSTTGNTIIYYMECNRCGHHFKSSCDDVLLEPGSATTIDDLGE